MAYDEKFRMCVIEYKDAGHTFKEVYETFGVDSGRYYSWKKQLAGTGSVKRQPAAERERKIDKGKLLQLVKEHPDWYLREFAEVFNVCLQAIQQMFKKLGVTRKKNVHVFWKIGGETERVFEAGCSNTPRKPGLRVGLQVR